MRSAHHARAHARGASLLAALLVSLVVVAPNARADDGSSAGTPEDAAPDEARFDDEAAPRALERDAPPSVIDDERAPASLDDEDAAPASSADPAGAPPSPVGDAPPPLDAPPGDTPETLPPPDARAPPTDDDARRARRETREVSAGELTLGATAGAMGGAGGAVVATTVSAFFAAAGLGALVFFGGAALATGGAAAPLFVFGLGAALVGFTLAGVVFFLSPAIAAVFAGMAMLSLAVDANEGDWLMLGACAAGIALAILTVALVLFSASVGVIVDPCGSPWPFLQSGPDGASLVPRPALVWSMGGAGLGALVGSIVVGAVAFTALPMLTPELERVGVGGGEATLVALGAVALGMPLGLVVGAAIGGGVGGALGVASEE